MTTLQDSLGYRSLPPQLASAKYILYLKNIKATILAKRKAEAQTIIQQVLQPTVATPFSAANQLYSQTHIFQGLHEHIQGKAPSEHIITTAPSSSYENGRAHLLLDANTQPTGTNLQAATVSSSGKPKYIVLLVGAALLLLFITMGKK